MSETTAIVAERRLLSRAAASLRRPPCRGQRDVEAAAAALHRDQQPRVGAVVDMVRHAGRFAAEQQDVAVARSAKSV